MSALVRVFGGFLDRCRADAARVVVRSGRCGFCGCRVPVVRSGVTVRHWHRFAQDVPDPDAVLGVAGRPRPGNPHGLRRVHRRVLCDGSGEPAGLLHTIIQNT